LAAEYNQGPFGQIIAKAFVEHKWLSRLVRTRRHWWKVPHMKTPPKAVGAAKGGAKAEKKTAEQVSLSTPADSPARFPGGLLALPRDFIDQVYRNRLLYPRPGDCLTKQ
jgi:hypothetical protein